MAVNNPALLEVCGVHNDEGTQAQWLGVSDLIFQNILSPLLGATLNHSKNRSGFSLGKVRALRLQRNKAMVQYFHISLLS